MPDGFGKTVDISRMARLRVGIKWDPLDRDTIGDHHFVSSGSTARKKISAMSRETKQLSVASEILKLFSMFRKKTGKTQRHVKAERIIHRNERHTHLMHKYLEEEGALSFDLDLYSFCYDANGELLGYLSPTSTVCKNTSYNDMAFIHSGDDETGTGDRFDEEILVNIDTISKDTERVFFVIQCLNHGFNEVKGGSWSVLNTAGELEIMSSPIATRHTRKLLVMCSMVMTQKGWALKDHSEYCLIDKDESIPAPDRINEAIRATFYLQDK